MKRISHDVQTNVEYHRITLSQSLQKCAKNTKGDGSLCFLTKPWEPTRLVALVEDALDCRSGAFYQVMEYGAVGRWLSRCDLVGHLDPGMREERGRRRM